MTERSLDIPNQRKKGSLIRKYSGNQEASNYFWAEAP